MRTLPLTVCCAAVVVLGLAACSSGNRAHPATTLAAGGCEPDTLEPASEVLCAVPRWRHEARLPKRALPGARVFAVSGCTTCDVYLGTGAQNLRAPRLSGERRRGRGFRWQIRHLRCPQCLVRNSPMPSFAALGPTRLRRLAIFLEASKGRRD